MLLCHNYLEGIFLAFRFSGLVFFDLSYWIKCIINPSSTLGIPPSEVHLFQIFASVVCDILWFQRNKAAHEGILLNALILTRKDLSLLLWSVGFLLWMSPTS